MSNRAVVALRGEFARIATTAKTTFADDDLEFVYSVRHCPSKDILINELRKSVDGTTPIIKHAIACRHCAFDLAMTLTAMNCHDKSLFDAAANNEENHSPRIDNIRVGDVCTIRPEGWTPDDYVTVSADGNVCYHAPVEVVVLSDPADIGTVSVAQLGYATKFMDASDIVIPGFDDDVIEAWNVYSMPLTDLVPTGPRVSQDIVAKVRRWIGAGRNYPSPVSEDSRQYKFLEIKAGNFFSLRCNFRLLNRIEDAENQS